MRPIAPPAQDLPYRHKVEDGAFWILEAQIRTEAPKGNSRCAKRGLGGGRIGDHCDIDHEAILSSDKFFLSRQVLLSVDGAAARRERGAERRGTPEQRRGARRGGGRGRCCPSRWRQTAEVDQPSLIRP